MQGCPAAPIHSARCGAQQRAKGGRVGTSSSVEQKRTWIPQNLPHLQFKGEVRIRRHFRRLAFGAVGHQARWQQDGGSLSLTHGKQGHLPT
eukprot:scaffold3051_cov112-Isochrysis_galbana.AAC.2